MAWCIVRLSIRALRRPKTVVLLVLKLLTCADIYSTRTSLERSLLSTFKVCGKRRFLLIRLQRKLARHSDLFVRVCLRFFLLFLSDVLLLIQISQLAKLIPGEVAKLSEAEAIAKVTAMAIAKQESFITRLFMPRPRDVTCQVITPKGAMETNEF
jgi:hypothetical protein